MVIFICIKERNWGGVCVSVGLGKFGTKRLKRNLVALSLWWLGSTRLGLIYIFIYILYCRVFFFFFPFHVMVVFFAVFFFFWERLDIEMAGYIRPEAIRIWCLIIVV